jgi:hypothetical protein
MVDPSCFFCKSFTITPDLQNIKSLVNGEIVITEKVPTGKDILEFEGLNYDLVFNPDRLGIVQTEGEHQLLHNNSRNRVEKGELLKAPLCIWIDPGYEILDINKVKVLSEKCFTFEV